MQMSEKVVFYSQMCLFLQTFYHFPMPLQIYVCNLNILYQFDCIYLTGKFLAIKQNAFKTMLLDRKNKQAVHMQYCAAHLQVLLLLYFPEQYNLLYYH